MTSFRNESIHDPATAHDPGYHGLSLVSGRVYKEAGLVPRFYIRLPPRDIPRYYATGKPAVAVEYVGVPTEFTIDDLRDILKAMA